jgi:hypothetical protein
MKTKKSGPTAQARKTLLTRIAATQRQADAAKKTAKQAKAGLKRAKQKFKGAKHAAKKLRKEVNALKAELMMLAVKKKGRKAPGRKPRPKQAKPVAVPAPHTSPPESILAPGDTPVAPAN